MSKIVTVPAIFVLTSMSLVVGTGCRKEPIGPPDEVKPGRRDYVWKVDTIYAPYNQFDRISGTSPTDLWTVNTGYPEKRFYHYDGVKWQTDMIRRLIAPTSIYSIAPDNVWAGGREGRIWHYDGSLWSENYRFVIDSTTSVVFEGIYATAPSNIYAIGACLRNADYWGVIVHFDGNAWAQVSIPPIRTSFINIRYDEVNSGKYYILGLSNEQYSVSTYQFYEFDGTNIRQIRAGTQATDQLGDILMLGNEIYFILGYDFYSYDFGTFNIVAHLTDSPKFLNAGIGRNEKDILLAMLDGIAHYNGTDTEYLYRFQVYTRITGFEIFAKDVFFIAWDVNGNDLVYHGVLN